MKKKKTTKCKKSFIAEAVIPYVANNFSFEGMLDNIIQGDNLRILKLIPDNSINLIITSPPYFKQRDYGGGIGNERTVEEYIVAPNHFSILSKRRSITIILLNI